MTHTKMQYHFQRSFLHFLRISPGRMTETFIPKNFNEKIYTDYHHDFKLILGHPFNKHLVIQPVQILLSTGVILYVCIT